VAIPDLDAVVQSGQEEFPDLRLIRKADSTFMRVLDVLLRIVTFNQQKQFLTRYTTTIGWTIYTPDTWESRSEASRIITVRHELVHFRQQKRYSRFLFGLLYLLVYFPVLLAWFRKKFEMEAYEESMRAIAQIHGPDALRNADRERVVEHFTGPDYAWCWPFRRSVEKWYDETRDRVLAEAEGEK
jgi:hypothetical protein